MKDFFFRNNLLILLIVLLYVPTAVTQQNITSISLNTEQNVTQDSHELKYFSVNVPSPTTDEILLITASAQISSYIDIYLSSTEDPDFTQEYKYPDYMNHTQECFYRSVDTCALQLSDNQNGITVYFSVEVDDPCKYTLSVSLQKIFEISVGHNYTVTFNKAESAMLKLPASQFVQNSTNIKQVVVKGSYSDYTSIGYFQLVAAIDEFPNDMDRKYTSESLNAFNKLLILNPLQNQNSTYYILIEGSEETKIKIQVYPVYSLEYPSININSSISYIITQPITYSYNNPFDALAMLNDTQQILPLFINLHALRGYGIFHVQYCNGLYNFTFQNTNGENGEIAITSQMRVQCFDEVEGDGGLLIETMDIMISDVIYDFGYEIQVSEGNYEVILFPGSKEYGILLETEDKRQIRMANLYSNGNSTETEVLAIVETITGSLSYQVSSCQKHKKKTKCDFITDLLTVDPSDSIQYFNFSCPTKSDCYLIITHQGDPQDSQFVVSMSYSSARMTTIAPNTPIIDFVELNAYNYYIINLTTLRADKNIQFSNATLAEIRNTIVNGDILILSSLSIPMPQFEDIFNPNSDVQVSWEGLITYTIAENSPQCIYLSVLGQSQSLYYLQYTFNTSANIPQRYMNIIDDAQNDYTLTANTSYILLKYSSHIIPFSIKFDPTPDCIAFGTKLPFDQNCASDPPTIFHDKVVYFNISQNFLNSQDSFKFTAYANSGEYLLEKDRPALIACVDTCYELVSVILKSDEARIIHSGFGSIKQIPNGQPVSNTVLVLQCAMPPCAFQLNASLPYGGQMQISYESEHSAEIEWYTKPFSFLETNNFFVRLPKYAAESTSIIFYSEAISLAVFYNIISLDEKYSNTLAYEYPTKDDFDGYYLSDPLRSISVITFDESVLSQKGCQNPSSLCVATLTIYGNLRVQYSREYILEGLGYYSSSSFSYSLDLNEPINLKRSYSISSFYYIYNEDTPNSPLYVSIEALSNCRPVIQLENSDTMYYKTLRIPQRMPGQSMVKFQVLTYELCRFQTAITTVPYEVILSNIMYPIDYNYEKGTNAIYTYHHTLYYSVSEIWIQTDSIVDAITVSELSLDNPIPPSESNNVAMAVNTKSLILKVPDNRIATFLISVTQKSSSSNQNSIILINKLRPITLLHNQQSTYTLRPEKQSDPSQVLSDSSVSYKYSTNSNFLIFIAVNVNSVNLTVGVEDAYGWRQQMILTTIITNQSEPWVVINDDIAEEDKRVNVNNQLKTYVITISLTEDVKSNTKVSLHVQQDGILGLPKLYNGVSYYDSFLHKEAMNCYQYHPIAEKTKQIVVDLFFTNQNLKYNQKIEILKGFITLHKDIKPLDQSFTKITPNVFRITANYYSDVIYKICYELQDFVLAGQQYSLVINVPDMEMIYPQQIIKKYDPKASYEMYQYINHKDPMEIQITLTNCLGKSQILASSSYFDMKTGKMTEIKPEWEWSVGGVSASMANVSHGYYYIGAKNKQRGADELYELNVKKAPIVKGVPQILEALFEIDWKIPFQAFVVTKDDKEYVGLIVPPIKNITAIKASKIVYSLYLMNLENPQVQKLPYTIDTYSRCPSLMPELKPYANNQTLSQSGIYFQILLSAFEPKSNISIRATISVPLQNQQDQSKSVEIINYYYGHDEIIIQYGSNGTWGVLKTIMIILFVLGCLLGISLAVRAYIIRRRRNTINFEAQQFQNAQIQMENKRKSGINDKSTKPINKDVGYGEFVDQIP